MVHLVADKRISGYKNNPLHRQPHRSTSPPARPCHQIPVCAMGQSAVNGPALRKLLRQPPARGNSPPMRPEPVFPPTALYLKAPSARAELTRVNAGRVRQLRHAVCPMPRRRARGPGGPKNPAKAGGSLRSGAADSVLRLDFPSSIALPPGSGNSPANVPGSISFNKLDRRHTRALRSRT